MSRIVAYIAAPLMLILFISLYLAWEKDSGYALYVIPSALGLVILYIMHPQIDWWWYNKHPKELDEKVRQLLERHFPFYLELNPEQKTRFRKRMTLFPMAKEFMPRGFETLPEDIKAMLAANTIMLTFGQKDYLLDKFQTIVVYPKPFPSPQFPRLFHAAEHFAEDGVLLFSAEQLMLGSLQAQQYFNIVLYELARIYPLHFPHLVLPELPANSWETLASISGFSKAIIEQTIGLPEPDIQAVAMCHFFLFPVPFKAQLPDLYMKYRGLFNLDPVVQNQPVVDLSLLG
jgi:Mlc titration factor MtfA (ptsG expression regulator)